jgi:uncharacterized protein involved in type VI secretion and phage assembly
MAQSTNTLNAVRTEVRINGAECVFTSLELHQSALTHHRFEIRVHYRTGRENVWTISGDDVVKRYLGGSVEIRMYHRESNESTEFRGVVTDVEIVGMEGDGGAVLLRGGSPTILLDRDPGMGAFVDYTLRDIVGEVLENSGVETEVTNKPVMTRQIPYAARYRESSYAFLSRLLASYGEWFYYDGKKLIVGDPHTGDSRTAFYSAELHEVRIATSIRKLNMEVYDYNAERNDYLEDDPPQSIDGKNFYTKIAEEAAEPLYPKPSKLPAMHPLMDEKDVVNTMRAFHCANYAKTCTFAARSNTCGIRVGGMVVAALGDGDGGAFERVTYKDLGRYLVLEITHRASGAGHYENSLWGVVGYTETLPADHIVLPRAFPEPATVTDNEDPKKQGRVKVKFLWQDPDDSAATTGWLRIQTPDAGSSEAVAKGRGFMFVPEKDDQVMIGFEQGDPSRPFVMGSLFHMGNAAEMPKGNAIRRIASSSGHVIEFNDDKDGDGWGISIYDGEGTKIQISSKEKSIKITAAENLELSAKNISIFAEENLTAGAKKDATLTAEGELSLAAKKNAVIAAEGDATVQAKGAATIVSEKDATIDGNNVSVSGKAETKISGQQTTVGGQMTTVQGAAFKIEVK